MPNVIVIGRPPIQQQLTAPDVAYFEQGLSDKISYPSVELRIGFFEYFIRIQSFEYKFAFKYK